MGALYVFLNGPLIFGILRSHRFFLFGFLYYFCRYVTFSANVPYAHYQCHRKAPGSGSCYRCHYQTISGRVLIEYDISQPPITWIWIGVDNSGFWREVIFECIFTYCVSCKHLGHSAEECLIVNPGLRKSQQPNRETLTTISSVQAHVDQRETSSLAMPFLLLLMILPLPPRVWEFRSQCLRFKKTFVGILLL